MTARENPAQVPSAKFIKYSFNPDDIVTDGARLSAPTFQTGSGMRRFATPEDKALRAGFTKVGVKQGLNAFFWYKEVWFVIEGQAQLEVWDKRDNTRQTVQVQARDALYFPEGHRVKTTNTGPTPLLFMYCAVPSSERESQWLAVMDDDDLKNVRQRNGYVQQPDGSWSKPK